MYRRRIKLVAAAAIVAIVLGGVSFWPSAPSENGQWWLGPPAAWGREIMAKLDKIEALVYRDQGVFVGLYGRTHVSGNWSKIYKARDRSRRDTYYEHTDEDTFGDSSPNSVLQDTTWGVPDGRDLKSTTVSFEFQCYTVKTLEGDAYDRDPLEQLRFYVGLLDKADRVLETKIFEGRECVGFEIDTSKYGDNPEGRVDRIWFDVKTKLPVRIEKHGRPLGNGLRGTFTTIQDRFEYYAKVDAEMFKPKIPDDFINAEPRELRAAREKQKKGQMVYADVPSGLGAEIAAALKDVKTAVFWKGYGAALGSGTKISLSERQWRRDSYSNGAPRRTEWFTVGRDDQGNTSFDFNDKSFQLTQTVVDFRDKWYKTVKYGRESHPDNPMDNILFLASWFDKADRFWENERIDGIECFGFELSAKKYGSNPDTSKDRIWFDNKTKLPVKMESEWLQDDGPRKRATGRFQWNPELPAETFIPNIPAGFVQVGSDGK
ncbi:MAG: hypothetical protein ACYTEK_00015 [Planctomycetota bacterium]|jgi:outer membrane lipoprotein-sorting protein